MKSLKEKRIKMKEVISQNMYKTVIEIFKNNFDFCIVINNNNDWDNELPDRLKNEKAFLLEIVDDTKEDSYITEDNELVICTDFGGELFTKVLQKEDILGIYDINKKALVQKSFKEKHPIKEFVHKLKNEPNPEKINNSMKMFKKYNSDILKEIKPKILDWDIS